MPVWQKAMEIAVECFSFREIAKKRRLRINFMQLRRSAESISANIAEAFGRRRSNKDKSRVYDISRSEAFETKNHLIYGNKVQYFTDEERQKLIEELDVVIYELNKIINYLNRD